MSNISRRKFLKGAGVAALAVAAAGVLAGCSDNKVPGTDVPETPATSATLHVMFVDVHSNAIAGAKAYDTTVLKDQKAYDPSLIPADALPHGYVVKDMTPVEINWNSQSGDGYVLIVVKGTAHVVVRVENAADGTSFNAEYDLDVNADTELSTKDITAPEGYAWKEEMSSPLEWDDAKHAYVTRGIFYVIKK